MCNSSIGAGALLLTGKVAAVGLIPMLFLLWLNSIISTISLYLLSEMAFDLDCGDYFVIGRAVGQRWEYVCMIFPLIYLFSTLFFYIDITYQCIGDFLSFIGSESFAKGIDISKEYNMVLTSVVAVLVLPLAVMRDMKALSKVSVVKMACMFYIAVMPVVHYHTLVTGITANPVVKEMGRDNPSHTYSMTKTFVFNPAVWVFSNLMFAFNNQFTGVSTVNVLRNPTKSRRVQLVMFSAIFTVLFYTLLSVYGYIAFGDCSAKVFIYDFGIHGSRTSKSMLWYWYTAKLLMGFVLLCTYPLMLDPMRASIEEMMNKAGVGVSKAVNTIRGIIITITLVVVPALSVIFCKTLNIDPENVLNLVCGICGSSLVYVFPSIFYLLLKKKSKLKNATKFLTVLSYVLLIAGVLIVILGTYSNIAAFTKISRTVCPVCSHTHQKHNDHPLEA